MSHVKLPCVTCKQRHVNAAEAVLHYGNCCSEAVLELPCLAQKE